MSKLRQRENWLHREQRGLWITGAIHSTKLTGNFGPKLNGSVRSNRKSFEKTGPPFEVVLFSRSDRLEFWLNGSHPTLPILFVSCTLKNNTSSYSMKSHSKCLKGQNFELKYEHINYVFPQQVCKPMKSPVGEYEYFLGQHLGKKVKYVRKLSLW